MNMHRAFSKNSRRVSIRTPMCCFFWADDRQSLRAACFQVQSRADALTFCNHSLNAR